MTVRTYCPCCLFEFFYDKTTDFKTCPKCAHSFQSDHLTHTHSNEPVDEKAVIDRIKTCIVLDPQSDAELGGTVFTDFEQKFRAAVIDKLLELDAETVNKITEVKGVVLSMVKPAESRFYLPVECVAEGVTSFCVEIQGYDWKGVMD